MVRGAHGCCQSSITALVFCYEDGTQTVSTCWLVIKKHTMQDSLYVTSSNIKMNGWMDESNTLKTVDYSSNQIDLNLKLDNLLVGFQIN